MEKDQEKRLVDLEIKFSFVEKDLAELSRVVHKLDDQLSELQRKLGSLTKIQDLAARQEIELTDPSPEDRTDTR